MQARRVATALLVLLPFSAQPACRPSPTTGGTQAPTANAAPATDTPAGESAEPAAPAPGGPEFKVQTEQFGDTRILRYQVPGFEALPLRSKQLVYYLYRAALAGRDIIWDQNYRHNLLVRRTLEAIVTTEATHTLPGYDALLEYTKRMWFSNGIHHHYSMKKLVPTFTAEQFEAMLKAVPADELPDRRKAKALLATLKPVLFDPKVAPKRVNLDPKQDLIQSSATNYYAGVTQKEVEAFYRGKAKKDDPKPISWGLNSQLAKRKGKLVERTWKVGGMYDPAIREIVKWLELAAGVAENDKQKLALEKLVAFYRTGELSAFDDYSIAWVADTDSVVDVVNGFIEVYGDPLGYRGAWESVVSIRDMEASKRIAAIGAQAQWFEDHAPIAKNHRKAKVTGISAKVILAVVEAGDSAPSTPIGINLPNANWVRAEHGSKSVNLGNIVHAYDVAKRQSGVLEEFAASKDEVARARKWGDIADALHTDMHEVIGHASGQLEAGVGQPNETLKNYANTLEEARADLVALYYMPDQKLVDIGVAKSTDIGKAAYDNYIRNGLMVQLARLELGEDLEESHMRNRQMIAAWVFEKGKPDKVIERVERDGKSYFVVRDYAKLRKLFGELLAEVQRIKSQGDYEAGKALVETYGVKVDRALHEQVRTRYAALGIAPYAGFIQPKLVPVMKGEAIVDVTIEYPEDFTQQMLEYAREASTLPTEN
ncbi:MAG: dihydrofolate reductase [Nannocystaceae bacterium]